MVMTQETIFKEEELKALGMFHLGMCDYDTCHRVSQVANSRRNEQTAVCAWAGLQNTRERVSLKSSVWTLALS